MSPNESLLKIDGLDSLSLIKSGVYKDTYHCAYKEKNARLGHYRIQITLIWIPERSQYFEEYQ